MNKFSRIKILSLINDDQRLAKMAESAKALAVTDASGRVCEVIATSLK